MDLSLSLDGERNVLVSEEIQIQRSLGTMLTQRAEHDLLFILVDEDSGGFLGLSLEADVGYTNHVVGGILNRLGLPGIDSLSNVHL